MALFIAAVLLWFAIRVFTVLMLVFLAVLAAIYLSAITDILERRAHMPRWVGLLCAVAGTFIVVAGVGALLLPPVIDQTQALIAGLPQTFADAQGVFSRWAGRYPVLRRTVLSDPASVGHLIDDGVGFLRGSLLPYMRAGGALFIEGVSVLVMALYFARQPTLYSAGVLGLVAPRHRALGARLLTDIGDTLRAWVVGQLLDMVALAAITAVGLWALSVPYWLAFGLLAGLAAIVPFFGTLVSTLVPTLFVLSSGDWVQAIAVASLGVAVHLIEANLLAPFIMEREVALPPALTIAAVLVMALLLGAVGLVVAVPVLAVAMVIVRDVVRGEMYGDAVASAEGPPAPTEAARLPNRLSA